MNAHNEQQALPCPFCGREPDLSFNSVSCGCAASPFIDREDALQVWNTRAAQPSPVVKQNLTTQPAAAQEAVAYWRVTFRMYPENIDCCETFVRGPDRPTLDTLGISPRPVQIISTEPLYAAPVTSAPAEVARAQTNMDAGWYARREEHARSLGYAGVAEALATLERAQSLPADIRSFSQGASFVMDAEDAFEKCADDLEKILRTPAAPEPSYLEYLDLQNHSLRRAIHAMMAKLVFLLDEDQFADIDAIALAAGVTPAAPGIDLRNAILQLQEDALHMKDPGDTVNAYNRVLAMIDASPKGDDVVGG